MTNRKMPRPLLLAGVFVSALLNWVLMPIPLPEPVGVIVVTGIIEVAVQVLPPEVMVVT